MKMLWLGCVLAVLAGPVLADGRDFERLDPETRALLGKFRDDWQRLPPEKREALVQRAQEWKRLPPEKREALKARHERFRQLPPAEQQALRERFREWRELPPEERRARRDQLRERLHDDHPRGGPPGQQRDKERKPKKDKSAPERDGPGR